MNIHELLNKMEAAETAFLQSEFLAPLLRDGRVRVRVAGVVCTLRVTGKAEGDWAILRPQTMEEARVVGQPTLRQVRDFLALFPAVRLVLVARPGPHWLALPAHRGDQRFRIEGPVPVHLVQGAEPFQTIEARFDGTHFWFEGIQRRRSPAIAAYLRDALAAESDPDALHKATLTAEERAAYRLAFQAIEAARRDRVELRLSEALAHAGAALVGYIEQGDAYTVRYQVGGQRYRSTVHKGDLSVLVAGICLSGQDRRFDLQSLVGVLREGHAHDQLVLVGDEVGLPEENYWHIHPEEEG